MSIDCIMWLILPGATFSSCQLEYKDIFFEYFAVISDISFSVTKKDKLPDILLLFTDKKPAIRSQGCKQNFAGCKALLLQYLAQPVFIQINII